MQVEIINDGAMNDAVNRIAESAADDQAKPGGGQPGSGSKSHHASNVIAARVSARRAVSADANSRAKRLKEMPRFHRRVKSRKGVNGLESTANWSERDRTANFCDLVNEDDNERDDASHQGRLHGKRPSILSSRSASASRGLTSGKSGDAVAGSK